MISSKYTERLARSTILVVEDDDHLCALYRERLIRHGAVVYAVPTAEEAVRLLTEDEIDLVILDLRLQGPTPASAVLEALQIENRDIPVVVITGIEEIESVRELLPFRVAAYHVKSPAVLATLPEIVSSALQIRDLNLRLRASEENLLATYAASPIPIGMVDIEANRFVEANRALQQLIGAGYAEITSASPHACLVNLLDVARQAETAGAVVTHIIRPDGARRSVEVMASRLTRDSRACLAVHLRDTTGMEEQRRRIEAIYRAASQAIVVTDLESLQYVDCNEAFERLIGYSHEEIIGHYPWEFRDPGEAARVRDMSNSDPIRLNEVREYRSSFRRKDGTILPVSIRLTGSEHEGRLHSLGFVTDLSSAQETQRQLDDLRSRLYFFFEQSSLLFLFIDGNGVVTEWNKAAEATLGLSKGTLVRDLIHPKKRSELQARWPAILDEKDLAGRWFITHQTPREEIVAVEWSHTTTRDESGNPLGILAIGEIVSNEREAELRARVLFDEGLSGMALLEAKTFRAVDLNPAMARCFGCGVTELKERPFLEWFDESDRQVLHSKLTTSIADSVSGQARGVRFDDSTFLFGFRATRVVFAGRPMVLVMGRDVTELARAERRYQALFEQTPSPMLIVTRDDGRILDCNPAFERLLGYSLEELRGMTCFELRDEEERVRILNLKEEALAAPGRLHREYESSFIRKDGQQILVRMVTSDFEMDGTAACISFLSDITEQRAAGQRERELERSLVQAQKMEAFGQMASGIAHEFNNILMAAMPWADIIGRTRGSDDAIGRAAAQILDALRRGKLIARHLLGFAQPQRPTVRSLNLANVLPEQIRIMRAAIPQEIDIVLETKHPSLAVRADAAQLNQVLLNLALNARDAMPGGGTLKIEVRPLASHEVRRWGFSAAEYMVLAVSDTGTGMEASVAARIFDPFFTTKDVGKGSGLGLAVVHRIIDRHGGMIFVDSNLGAGTTFYILLPRSLEAASDPSVDRDAETHGVCERKHVLIIDDEVAISEGMRVLLEIEGAIVATASHGEEGLAIIDSGVQCDLVILDLGLPGMKGEQVYEQIRRRLPHVPIVIASGFGEVDRIASLLEDGKVRFRQKPYDLTELIGAIAELDAAPSTLQSLGRAG